MRIIHSLLALLLPIALTTQALAEPLTITYKTPENPAALQLHQISQEHQNAPATWQIEGLPFPGTVLWRPGPQQLAYQHPTEVSWLVMNLAELPATVTPTLTLGAASQAWQGAPTRRVAVSANRQTCGALFTAPTLGAGLSVADLQNTYALLSWLNTGQTAAGCLAPFPAQTQLGLPTRWASPMGQLVLEAIRPTPPGLSLSAWPTVTYSVTPEVRLRLLLSQLPVPERAAFLRQNAHLPLLSQIDTLAAYLGQSGPTEP